MSKKVNIGQASPSSSESGIEGVRLVYFLGVGGIGMSAIARYFNSLDCKVVGYDKTKTILTEKLESEGVEIHYDENVNQIPNSIKNKA